MHLLALMAFVFLPGAFIEGLGKLQILFTALFQTFAPIGFILLILGVLVLLIPQTRRFLGSLI